MKVSLPAVLLLGCMLSLQAAAQKLFGSLTEINDINFRQTVVKKPNSMWLVAFYVPWC